ncbi:MAG: acyl carrier protein [Bdellovibrionota bacterium]
MATSTIDQVNKLMIEGFEIPEEKLKPEAHLFTELGLDSLDAVDMVVYLEEKIQLKVDAEKMAEVRTLADVYKLVDDLVAEKEKLDANP